MSKGGFLFMGIQPDPEMDVAIGRGIPRIYDGTAELTEEEAEQIRQWHRERDARSAAYTGKRGSHALTGGGLCTCGRCLWEWCCPLDPLYPRAPAPRLESER